MTRVIDLRTVSAQVIVYEIVYAGAGTNSVQAPEPMEYKRIFQLFLATCAVSDQGIFNPLLVLTQQENILLPRCEFTQNVSTGMNNVHDSCHVPIGQRLRPFAPTLVS